jgi:hypothetical protein
MWWAHTVPAPLPLKRVTPRSGRRRCHYTHSQFLLANIKSERRLRHKMEEGYFVLKELLMLLYRESELLFSRLGRGLASFSVVGRDFVL